MRANGTTQGRRKMSMIRKDTNQRWTNITGCVAKIGQRI